AQPSRRPVLAFTVVRGLMAGPAWRADAGQRNSPLNPDENGARRPPPVSKPAANPNAPATPAPGTSNVVKLNLQNLSNTSAPAATAPPATTPAPATPAPATPAPAPAPVEKPK